MAESPKLCYSFQGADRKQTALYLHGFLGCKEDWGGPVALFAKGWSSLSVDLPGHGDTAALQLEDHDFTMDGCAARLIDLLDYLAIKRCHLMAYSMGGRLGLYLLTHYPDRFEAAVIESASPGLQTEDERIERKEHDAMLADQLANSDFQEFLDRWYAQPLFASIDRPSSRFGELMKRRQKGNSEQLARSLRLMGTGVQPSLWNQLGDITCPILFAAGELDHKYRQMAERMLPLCPKGRVAIIPGAGHNSHFERPVEFGETIRRFLEEYK